MPTHTLSESSSIDAVSLSQTFPPPPVVGVDPTASGALESMSVDINSLIANRPGIFGKRERESTLAEQDGTVDQQIFYGFWLTPKVVRAGLIANDIELDVLVWNSDPYASLIVTQVQGVNPTGTQLITPSVPFALGAGGYQINELTIFESGPPTQNTQYIYTAGAFSQTLTISGLRVVAFNYLPDWERGVDIQLLYKTIIYRNKRFYEQRRPRITTPLRKLRANYLFDGQVHSKFLNEYRQLHKNVLAVPIYTEVMTPILDLQGLSIIDVNEDISDYYNLQALGGLVMIHDLSDIFKVEVKELVSATSSQITVDSPVAGNFLFPNTLIFAVFAGIIVNKNIRVESDGAAQGSIDFEEFRPEETV